MTETTATAHSEIVVPGVEPSYRGKVRDLYDLGATLVIVATDRISAYDSILPTPIPGKGRLLTQTSAFWFAQLPEVGAHHLISTRVEDFPTPFAAHAALLDGRTMFCHKTARIDFECVVRGYLAGSGWREYRESGRVCGIALPPGLRESERLPEPIFTPATKADSGHDENVPFAALAAAIGDPMAGELRRRALAIYVAAQAHAAARGILIADTKIEFGLRDGRPLVIDELLTPDSSRFWPAADYAPGRAQQAFDKQFVRDHLDAAGWDHNPPAPALPAPVVARTAERYQEAYRRLTGPARR